MRRMKLLAIPSKAERVLTFILRLMLQLAYKLMLSVLIIKPTCLQKITILFILRIAFIYHKLDINKIVTYESSWLIITI